MQFENVIGQVVIKKHLIDLVLYNRLSHALLFLGKEGSGSLSMALAFAQYIVCTSITPAQATPALFDEVLSPFVQGEADSCGKCPSCIKAKQYIHPDIHFSFPVIPKKAGTPPVSDDYIIEWRQFITTYPYGNVFDWLQFL